MDECSLVGGFDDLGFEVASGCVGEGRIYEKVVFERFSPEQHTASHVFAIDQAKFDFLRSVR